MSYLFKVLIKLRDEMKNSLELQQKLEKAQYDMEKYKTALENGKNREEEQEATRKLKVRDLLNV
jgi:hypothetical protein